MASGKQAQVLNDLASFYMSNANFDFTPPGSPVKVTPPTSDSEQEPAQPVKRNVYINTQDVASRRKRPGHHKGRSSARSGGLPPVDEEGKSRSRRGKSSSAKPRSTNNFREDDENSQQRSGDENEKVRREPPRTKSGGSQDESENRRSSSRRSSESNDGASGHKRSSSRAVRSSRQSESGGGSALDKLKKRAANTDRRKRPSTRSSRSDDQDGAEETPPTSFRSKSTGRHRSRRPSSSTSAQVTDDEEPHDSSRRGESRKSGSGSGGSALDKLKKRAASSDRRRSDRGERRKDGGRDDDRDRHERPSSSRRSSSQPKSPVKTKRSSTSTSGRHLSSNGGEDRSPRKERRSRSRSKWSHMKERSVSRDKAADRDRSRDKPRDRSRDKSRDRSRDRGPGAMIASEEATPIRSEDPMEEAPVKKPKSAIFKNLLRKGKNKKKEAESGSGSEELKAASVLDVSNRSENARSHTGEAPATGKEDGKKKSMFKKLLSKSSHKADTSHELDHEEQMKHDDETPIPPMKEKTIEASPAKKKSSVLNKLLSKKKSSSKESSSAEKAEKAPTRDGTEKSEESDHLMQTVSWQRQPSKRIISKPTEPPIPKKTTKESVPTPPASQPMEPVEDGKKKSSMLKKLLSKSKSKDATKDDSQGKSSDKKGSKWGGIKSGMGFTSKLMKIGEKKASDGFEIEADEPADKVDDKSDKKKTADAPMDYGLMMSVASFSADALDGLEDFKLQDTIQEEDEEEDERENEDKSDLIAIEEGDEYQIPSQRSLKSSSRSMKSTDSDKDEPPADPAAPKDKDEEPDLFSLMSSAAPSTNRRNMMKTGLAAPSIRFDFDPSTLEPVSSGTPEAILEGDEEEESEDEAEEPIVPSHTVLEEEEEEVSVGIQENTEEKSDTEHEGDYPADMVYEPDPEYEDNFLSPMKFMQLKIGPSAVPIENLSISIHALSDDKDKESNDNKNRFKIHQMNHEGVDFEGLPESSESDSFAFIDDTAKLPTSSTHGDNDKSSGLGSQYDQLARELELSVARTKVAKKR